MASAIKRSSCEILVIGGGPAGGNAAIAATEAGAEVLLIDENPVAGGQIWRAPSHDGAVLSRAGDPDMSDGDRLRARMNASGFAIRTGVSVWSVVRKDKGFEVAVSADNGSELIFAARIIVATGAQERVVPFSGWTTPGVFGLAAATVLIKAEGVLPGRRMVVAGQGPLLVAVAAKAVALGKPPVAVVDYNPRVAWARSLTGFARRPSALLQGLKWRASLMRAGVPYYYSSEVINAEAGASGQLKSVTIRRNDRVATETFEVDTAYFGNSLVPGDEIVGLLGAERQLDPKTGGWMTVHDELGRTSVEQLYVAGDTSRIRGGLPAAAHGRLVGLAAAKDGGRKVSEAQIKSSLADRARLDGFANASCSLMYVGDNRIENLADNVVLCRCEDVTVGQVREAIRSGAVEANQVKHFTRLGMGPCQARFCGPNLAALLRQTVSLAPGQERLTPRSPIRPVPVPDMAGEFQYSDIPVPKPAPL